MALIQIGAEARVSLKDGIVEKERLPKEYRYAFLDLAIRKANTRKEARLLEKAGGVTVVPRLLGVREKDFCILMEYVEGEKLRDCFHSVDRKGIFCRLGKEVAKLHDANIIHGDLTTSNVIVGNGIHIIDFGLGFVSTKVEDKAVDVHLFEKVLESSHSDYAKECRRWFMEGYLAESKNGAALQMRLEKVRKRGRYK